MVFKPESKKPSPPRQKLGEVREGVWVKCRGCGKALTRLELSRNYEVCPECGYHFRIGAKKYFEILFDQGEYQLLFENLRSVDFLQFTDRVSYQERLSATIRKTGLSEAILIGAGRIGGCRTVVACMDFSFIGGSMGSVVGERFTLAAEYAVRERVPLLAITQSGGARMMESIFSLMQMAKTAIAVAQMHEYRIPYWVLLTDPTTGGVSASFAMLGDVVMAEPGALIGFAGPRVIKEAMKCELPEDFQRAESVLKHGFVDFIVPRPKLKETICTLHLLFSH